MELTAAELRPGLNLPSITKKIEQKRIDVFETWGPEEWHSEKGGYHTDVQAAERVLGGFSAPIASGRMLVDYGVQAIARWFGKDVASHSTRVELRFLVPVVDGDELCVNGSVTHMRKRDIATEVSLEMWIENQKDQKVAIGTGRVVVS